MAICVDEAAITFLPAKEIFHSGKLLVSAEWVNLGFPPPTAMAGSLIAADDAGGLENPSQFVAYRVECIKCLPFNFQYFSLSRAQTFFSAFFDVRGMRIFDFISSDFGALRGKLTCRRPPRFLEQCSFSVLAENAAGKATNSGKSTCCKSEN